MTSESMRRETISVALAAALVHALVACAGIFGGATGTYAWHDEVDYHLPTIRTFASELPAPNLGDYHAATAPAYQLLAAVAMRAGVDGTALHLASALFGVALVALFTAFVARCAGRLAGLAAGLALGLSPYTVNPSVFLATDNLAIALVIAAFACAAGIATGASATPARGGVFAALIAVAAVSVRQIMAYTAAFPGAALVARACADRRLPKIGAVLAAGAALVPSLILLAVMVKTWGGLVPPSFKEYHGRGGNPATPVYALALVSIWGGAAFVSVPGFLREVLTRRAAIAGVAAAAVACVVPSSYLVHVRFGGTLWTLASKVPAIADRSLLLVPLAGVGAAMLVAYLRLWSRHADPAARGLGAYALLAYSGVVLAQTANSQCFERYLQPLTLVFMTIAAAAIAGRSMRAWPLGLAALISLCWSVLSLLQGGS
jgi:hypothetical protein